MMFNNFASIDIGDKHLSLIIGNFSSDPKHKKKTVSESKLDTVAQVISGLTITGIYLINVSDETKDGGLAKRCERIISSGKRNGQKCGKIALDNINGVNVCGIHGGKGKPVQEKIAQEKTLQEKTQEKTPKKAPRKSSLIYTNKQKFCHNLISVLNGIDMKNIGTFIIERQPPKNRIMSEISHYVYMYLIGMIGSDQSRKIVYYNARKRMKLMCDMFAEKCQEDGVTFAKNTTYTARKKNSIKLATFLMEKYIKSANGVHKIGEFQKQDDVSDCVIQLIFYVAGKFLKSF
jgi:hypothetical protein